MNKDALSAGKPLSAKEQADFAEHTDADLSSVRIHTDKAARDAAEHMNADAFTIGDDIAFAEGKYQPGTAPGKELMAHELTHVGEQKKVAGIRGKIQRQRKQSESDPSWDETYTSTDGVYVMNEPNERYIGIVKNTGTKVLISRYLKAVIHGRTYFQVKVAEGAYDYKNQYEELKNLEGWILADLVKDTQWQASPRTYIKMGSSWQITFKQNGKEYRYVYTASLYVGKPYSRHNTIFVAPDKRNPSMVELNLTRFVDGEKQKDDYNLRIESLPSQWQNINLLNQSKELQKVFDMGFQDKMKDLLRAIELSEKYFKPAFERVFKDFTVEIMHALWDFFKAALFVYGIAVLGGAAAGAILAFILSGGPAVPVGIAAGVKLGNTFGLAAIELLGMFYLAQIIVLIGKPMLVDLGDFIITAWNAHHDEKKLDAAAKSFAEGISILAYAATLVAIAVLVNKGRKGFNQSKIGKAAWEKVDGIKKQLRGKAEESKLVKKLDEIIKDSDEGLKQVSKTGIPQGLTKKQFKDISKLIKENTGHFSDDIAVHGSRANFTAKSTSDIDIAIRMSPSKFQQFINKRLQTLKPGGSKWKTIKYGEQVGKIHSGECGLSGFRVKLEKILGMDVDISLIKIGGKFDKGPYIPLK